MKMIKQPTIPPMPKRPTFDARDTQYNLPIGTDCISRQAAIDALYDWEMTYDWDDHCREEDPKPEYIVSPSDAIKRLPPAEQKKGKWISADAMFGGVPFYCSECGENTRDTVMGKPRWKFCPMCGAKMEVTE